MFAFPLTAPNKEAITNILLVALVGVIVTDSPVMSVYELLFVEKVSVLVVLTTCNTAPAPKLDRAAPMASFVAVTAPSTILVVLTVLAPIVSAPVSPEK